MNAVVEALRGRLVVSCQAYPGEPMLDPRTMAQIAQSAVIGGAAGIRAKGLDDLRAAWKNDHSPLPKGLSCSESKEGQFIMVAAESAFVTIPGACVIKGIGAVELVTLAPVFEEGSNSKTLILKATPEGWKFSVKFMPPIIRERNTKKL